MEMVGIGGAAAAAVESGKAVPAFFLGVNVALLKLLLELHIGHAVRHISHKERLTSHKLMAGIQIPPWRDCQVFCPRTTAGKALCHARPALQIYHKVEKLEWPPLPLPPDDFHCQPVIFRKELGQILCAQRIIFLRRCHHRLHGYLLKAQIRQMQHILREIQVVVGKRPAHIIFLLAPALGKLLEFGYNQVIAACPLAEGAHPVIDLPAPVNA